MAPNLSKLIFGRGIYLKVAFGGYAKILIDVYIYSYSRFPRQNLKRFTYRVKSTDSIFFLLGLSPIVN